MLTDTIGDSYTSQITESSTTPESNTSKPSWYTKIRDNPEEMEKLRQKRRVRHHALKLIRESLPPNERPEKNPTKHYTVTEAKRSYNIKYYSTHKEKVDKYINEYLKKGEIKREFKISSIS